MLTKEEVIILRTIFLEFGDEELRQKRLQFPYENLEYENIEDAVVPKQGKRYKANVSTLIENLESFGRPEIDEVVSDNYYSYIVGDNCGFGGDFEGVVVVEGKRTITEWEDDDGEMASLKKYSKSDFFINLRMGLYYKGFGKYEKAVEHFSAAIQEYRETFSQVVEQAAERLRDFFDKYYDLEKRAFKDTYTPGKDFIKQVEIPRELLCTIEEMPSFHLGEICLDQGGDLILNGRDSEAENIFRQANQYFEESEQAFCSIFYGQDSKDYKLGVLRELNVISLPTPIFSRNYYLEKNLILAKSKSIHTPDQTVTGTEADTLKQLKPYTDRVKTVVQQECQMRYKGWEKLSQGTQKFIIEAAWQEKIDSEQSWRNSIMNLSNALENELTDKLLPLIPDSYRKKPQDKTRLLKISDFKYVIDNYGKMLFYLSPEKIGELSKKLRRLSEIRGEKGSHPIKIPSFKDVRELNITY